MSECPHTDNADKCTCGPGCGCPGYDTSSARENVATAIWEKLHEVSGVVILPCSTNDLADAAIAAHLEALKADGYTIVRPVTAEEEAANDW